MLAANDFADAIPPGLWDIGAKGLVGLFVILMFTGKVVSSKERDFWRDAFLEEQRQNSKLLAGAETTNKVLRALPGQETAE